jgi:hypothetical protein
MGMEKKAIGKVYINIRKIMDDYLAKTGKRFSKMDAAIFIIKKGHPRARLTQFTRKTKESSIYELTFTEIYNFSVFLEMPFKEFLDRYCKAI